MPLTWDTLLEIQAESRAEAIPLTEAMLEWDEQAIRQHFESLSQSNLAAACESCDLSTESSIDPHKKGLVLVARRIWDGLSDVCMESNDDSMLCVAVEGQTIVHAGSLSELPVAWRNSPRCDFGDSTIMPGLIDAHVHMEFDPCFPLHEQPPLDHEALMQRMQVSLLLCADSMACA